MISMGVQPTIAYNPGMISLRVVVVMAMSAVPKSKKHGRAYFFPQGSVNLPIRTQVGSAAHVSKGPDMVADYH